jgi:hypothetical protein
MVQRGYGTSIFVLFARRASVAGQDFNKYISTGISERAAHWPLSIATAKLPS